MKSSRSSLASLAILLASACGDDAREPAPPPPGPSPGTAARVDAEPASANCPRGGFAIQTGTDDDGDGALDDSEIEATRYACDGAAWKGDFGEAEWKDPTAVAALRQARVLDGTLSLVGSAPVELPALEIVTGGIWAARSVPAMSFRSLWMVHGGIFIAERATIGRIDLPALRTVGSLDIGGTAPIAELRLPSLEAVGGNLRMWYAASIDRLAMPALTHVRGDLYLAATTYDLRALIGVDGTMSITGPLRDLDGLGGLQVVGGSLQLGNVPSMTRLALPTLEHVGGDLGFNLDGRRDALETIALPRLGSVGGMVRIQGAHALTTLDLSAIEAVGDRVDLLQLPRLTTLRLPVRELGTATTETALSIRETGLVELELPLTGATGRVVIEANPALTTLRLPGATQLLDVSIRDNAALASVAIPAATSLGLSLSGSPRLTTLDLHALEAAASLELRDLGLTDLSALSALRRVSRLTLTSLPLTSLQGLPPLTELDDLELSDLDALTSLAGLEHLTRVGVLTISGCERLADLRALAALTRIGGDEQPRAGVLTLVGDPALRDLSGLDAVTQLGGLAIIDDDGLVDLRGLGAVTRVAGDVRIDHNDALTGVDGLAHLMGVGGALAIYRNPQLASLEGLADLRSVGAALTIADHPALTRLGLAALSFVNTEIRIVRNARLEPDDVRALLAQIGRP